MFMKLFFRGVKIGGKDEPLSVGLSVPPFSVPWVIVSELMLPKPASLSLNYGFLNALPRQEKVKSIGTW